MTDLSLSLAPVTRGLQRGLSLTLPFALAFSVIVVSPGVSQAQYTPPVPVIDGKKWKEAVDYLRYSRPYKPKLNRTRAGLRDVESSFTTLVDYTSEARLVTMLEDPTPNLRVFAFFALQEQSGDPARMFNVAFDKLRDEDVARSGGGCIVYTTMVADAIMTPAVVESLTALQRRRVLDYLLFEPNGLRLTDRALREWTIPKSYRGTLRRLADNGRPAAMVALARQGDPRDISFIIERADKHHHVALEIMREYPRDEYFATLESMSEKMFADSWPDYSYYHAVAAYGAQRAVPLMHKALDTLPAERRDTHASRIFDAVTPVAEKDRGFMPILWKLWEIEQRVDDNSFELMWAEDKQRTQKMMHKTLREGTLEHISGALVVRMLRLSSDRRGRSIDANLWTRVLDRANYFHIDELITYLGNFRPPAAVEPLFTRLLEQRDGYLLEPIVRAILAYKRDDLRARLNAAVKQNKHLNEGWTGNRIANLLREQNKSASP